MAANATTTRRASWKRAYRKFAELSRRLEAAQQPREREKLERALAAQQDKLLEMEAPSFLAVMHKLEILWEGELEGVDQASEEKRQIVSDLSELCAEAAATVGYSSPFGSGT